MGGDILRCILLYNHGGVCVDCSLIPMHPLTRYINLLVNDTNFFTYRFLPSSKGKCERTTVNWMLVSSKEHYVLRKWVSKFMETMKSGEICGYFAFHNDLSKLYKSDEETKEVIDNMVQISEKIPHNMPKRKEDIPLKSYVYKRPKNLDVKWYREYLQKYEL